MAIATAVFYLIALALPVWLVVEEIAHHQRRAASRPRQRASAPSATAKPATHTA
ncbi:MAG TPA: hypothetical protein VIE36_10865 [Methylomirabilota bacterium]|jgi:hypothetical protein